MYGLKKIVLGYIFGLFGLIGIISVLDFCQILNSIPQSYGDDQAEKLLLVQKFAPLVKLHHWEEYFPSSVEWYLDRSDLFQDLDPWGLHTSRISLRPIFEPPASFISVHSGPSYYLSPYGNEIQRKLTYQGEPIQNHRVMVPCYSHLIENETRAIIQYLFFYPYNGTPFLVFDIWNHWSGSQLSLHEGDWEHIDVYLEKTQEEERKDFEITQIFYSRHSPGMGIMVPAETAEFSETTHPIVYSAFHGHASYPHPVTGVSRYLDRTSSEGPEWRCWDQVVPVGDIQKPEPGKKWIQYSGRWGRWKAPLTPPFQSWWKSLESLDF